MSVPMTKPETINFLLGEIKVLESNIVSALTLNMNSYAAKLKIKIADMKAEIVEHCVGMGWVQRTGRKAELNIIDDLSKKIIVLQEDLKDSRAPDTIKKNQRAGIHNYKLQIRLACIRLKTAK